MLDKSFDKCWLALMVKCRWEAACRQILEANGYECFLPVQWSRKRNSKPAVLFRGYLFCRFIYANKWRLNTTPGLLDIVTFGGQPPVIEEKEIEQLRRVVSADAKYAPTPYLALGSRVVLGAGPLRGLEGIIARSGDKDRLIISINMLQRSVAVEVERDWLDLADAPEARPLEAMRASAG